MYKLFYTEEADWDLVVIYNYIAEDSPERVVNYLGKIEKCVLQLQDFPNFENNSRYAELNKLGVKMLPFEDYLIFYTVNSRTETVNVIRVLHDSVNYRRLF